MKRLSFGLLLIPYVAIGQVSVATSFSGNMGFAKEMTDCYLEKTIPGKEVTALFAGELRGDEYAMDSVAVFISKQFGKYKTAINHHSQ